MDSHRLVTFYFIVPIVIILTVKNVYLVFWFSTSNYKRNMQYLTATMSADLFGSFIYSSNQMFDFILRRDRLIRCSRAR